MRLVCFPLFHPAAAAPFVPFPQFCSSSICKQAVRKGSGTTPAFRGAITQRIVIIIIIIIFPFPPLQVADALIATPPFPPVKVSWPTPPLFA
jgi:hypothetical protein